MTAQWIYEDMGFLLMSSHEPCFVGEVVENHDGYCAVGIPISTKMVVKKEISRAEVQLITQRYFPGERFGVMERVAPYWYAVVAE